MHEVLYFKGFWVYTRFDSGFFSPCFFFILYAKVCQMFCRYTLQAQVACTPSLLIHEFAVTGYLENDHASH